MSHLRITCPHCEQAMLVKQADAQKTLKCSGCKQKFRNQRTKDEGTAEKETTDKEVKEKVPTKQVKYATGKQVVGVACQSCGQRFGIKPEMSGKRIVCPVCASRQRFDLVERPPEQKIDSSGSTKEKSLNQEIEKNKPTNSTTANPAASKPDTTKPVVKKKPESGNRATVVHSSNQSPESNTEMSQKVIALLPPRYLVDEQIDRQATESLQQEQQPDTGGIRLGIDTQVTRIHKAGEAIEVSSLSLEQKRRRRRLRVAIVFSFSVIVLVGWFIWLMQRLSPGS